MGRKLTAKEMEIIEKSPWVDSVDKKNQRILWKESFKQHFIGEYTAGKTPLEIFREAGFSKELLGSKRIERAAARWREAYYIPVRRGNPKKPLTEKE